VCIHLIPVLFFRIGGLLKFRNPVYYLLSLVETEKINRRAFRAISALSAGLQDLHRFRGNRTPIPKIYASNTAENSIYLCTTQCLKGVAEVSAYIPLRRGKRTRTGASRDRECRPITQLCVVLYLNTIISGPKKNGNISSKRIDDDDGYIIYSFADNVQRKIVFLR